MSVADRFLDMLSQYFQRLSHNKFRSTNGIEFSGVVVNGVFYFGNHKYDSFSYNAPIADPNAVKYIVDTIKQLKPGIFHG